MGGSKNALSSLRLSNAEDFLPSAFDVTGFATSAVAVCSLAIAEFKATRTKRGSIDHVEVDSLDACAAFLSESLFSPLGWEYPSAWDSIAGDYQAKDRWIRLHTNYAHHRSAVLNVLGVERNREKVADAVAGSFAADLEAAVLQEGGCASVMYTEDEWAADPQGGSTLHEPPVSLIRTRVACDAPPQLAADGLPLEGIRVLDLTRVIAGPECTRILAAHGADVLRIDPVAFEEVPAIIPDFSVGKRCAAVDLASVSGRSIFEQLVAKAQVVVIGYRSGALARFGITDESLRALNSCLIIARLNAYGWSGLLADRRGFDSLVQMSCGIAAQGMVASGSDKPVPLPAQALDHGAGFLLAAGICRALTHQITTGETLDVRASLIGVANFLKSLPRSGTIGAKLPIETFAPALVRVDTHWGPAVRVRSPGLIDGVRGDWKVNAGPLGRHEPTFATGD